jgi:hypothetical protein
MSSKTTAIVLSVLAFLVGQSSAQSADPAKPAPTGLIGRSKTWAIPNADILRGDGIAAVKLRNATFTLHDSEK